MLCQVSTGMEMKLRMRIGSDFPIFRLDLRSKRIGVDENVHSRFYCHCPLPKLLKQISRYDGADMLFTCPLMRNGGLPAALSQACAQRRAFRNHDFRQWDAGQGRQST